MTIGLETTEWGYGCRAYRSCEAGACYHSARFYTEDDATPPKHTRLCREHIEELLAKSPSLLVEALIFALEEIQQIKRWKEGE